MFRSIMKVLTAKEETVYNTDSEPTVASNAIQAQNIKISYKGDVLERNTQRSNLSPVAPVTGKRSIEISFDCEVKGSGTAGTAGKLGDLIEACGFSEAVSVGSSIIYTPSSATMKSITIYVYDIPDTGSARLHKVTGARGNLKLTLEAGQIAKAEFSFKGIYNAPADITAPSAPTFESQVPAIVQSSQFSLNSVTSLVVQALSLDMGNEITESENISSTGGIAAFYITARKPSGTFSPEAVTVATYAWWTDWLAASQRAMSVVVGSVAGNICTITAPKVTVDQVTEADRNGVTVDEVPFRCAGNAGNDEVQIKFT